MKSSQKRKGHPSYDAWREDYRGHPPPPDFPQNADQSASSDV